MKSICGNVYQVSKALIWPNSLVSGKLPVMHHMCFKIRAKLIEGSNVPFIATCEWMKDKEGLEMSIHLKEIKLTCLKFSNHL